MKNLDSYYDETGVFQWPCDLDEAVEVARTILITEFESHSRHWVDFGRDLLINPAPQKPYERSWSRIAKQDRTLREVFAGLTVLERETVLDLLRHCVSGAVFSCLVTLDQFPHGQAELFVRPTIESGQSQTIKLAPADMDLHDEFEKS